MRALSVSQPWATLIAIGDKTIETRSWSTPYRGPLAIHAAASIPKWAIEWLEETAAARTCLQRAGYVQISDLPVGAVIATCQLVGCAGTDGPTFVRPEGKDAIFGNFGPHRHAFYLRDIARVEPPIPAKGSLGMWEWDEKEAGIEVRVTGRLF